MGDGPNKAVRMSLDSTRTRKSAQGRIKKRTFLLERQSTITGKKEPIGNFAALMHLLRVHLDVNLFLMGVFVKYNGYAIVIPLAMFIGLMNLHCQHLYIAAMEEVARKQEPELVHPSVTETVIYTFEDSPKAWIRKCAQIMGRIVNYCLCVLHFGYSAAYLIFSAYFFCALVAFETYRTSLIILVLPAWLFSTFKTLKTLTCFNACANLLTLVSVGALIYHARNGFGKMHEKQVLVIDMDMFIVVGILSYITQAVVPVSVIYWEVKNPKSFTALLGPVNISAVISLLMHLFVGFIEYFHWGETFVFSKVMKTAKIDIVGTILCLGISLSVIIGYALNMYIGFETMYPQFYKKVGPFTQKNQVMCIAKTVVIAITSSVSNMLEMMTILSMMCGSIVAVILPAVLDLIRLNHKLTKFIIIKNIFIIVCGLLPGVGCVMFFRDVTS